MSDSVDPKPLLIFDGKCGFCRIWIDYWKQLTGDRVAYTPYQEAADAYPEIPPEAFRRAVHLARPDRSFASGARAVVETIRPDGVLVWLYERLPGFAPVAEAAYKFIAAHRDLFYQVTKYTFGLRIETARFERTQWLFLRLLALVYAIAFASFAVQVTGLIGERGIAPVQEFFKFLEAELGGGRYYQVPSIFWLGASDFLLRAGCWAGVAVAAVVFIGRFERLCLILLYVLYLSYSMVGQVFMGFQWDALLLEAGFFAVFFGRSATGLLGIAWLYRWLVFRLYFLSGFVKLASGDPNWSSLRALDFHYLTQPLPTIVAWYADKAPHWFQAASTFLLLAIELGAPFLMFGPRMWRLAGAWALLVLQILIALTGNYTFFNLLTMILTLFLFDDQAVGGVVEKLRFFRGQPQQRTNRRWAIILLTPLFCIGWIRLYDTVFQNAPAVLRRIEGTLSPFQIANAYGLFAVMTTSRPEIVVEGSSNGADWQPYEFRYKPGDLIRAPRWVAPHQPRLDWQMWFAALGEYAESPWFLGFLRKLLEGSPDVTGLLARNPFPDHPPRYVRAVKYEYLFSTAGERASTGQWWTRTRIGEFVPPMSLRTDENPKIR